MGLNFITVAQTGSNTIACPHTTYVPCQGLIHLWLHVKKLYTSERLQGVCSVCVRAWSADSDVVPNSCGSPHLHNLLLNALSNAGRSAHCHELCVSNTHIPGDQEQGICMINTL